MIATTHLDNHHRRTAEAILSHPVSHNIEWREVLSLLEAIGEVTEEHNGKFKVSVGGETETLRPPERQGHRGADGRRPQAHARRRRHHRRGAA